MKTTSLESHVKHSNALHSVVRGRGSYLVGPLARFNLNFDKLPEVARNVALEAGLRPPVKNPFRSIVVRAVELVFACDEALRIIREYEPPARRESKFRTAPASARPSPKRRAAFSITATPWMKTG